MKKIVFLIISCVLLLCFAVGLCLYVIPANVKINELLQATKLDKDANMVGSTQIALHGSFKKYLFKEDSLEIFVAPFDNLKNFQLVVDGDNTGFAPTAFDDFIHITYTAWDDSKEDLVFGTITVSKNFEYWAFLVHDNEQPVYYIASSGDHTLAEIVQYFRGLVPGYKAP